MDPIEWNLPADENEKTLRDEFAMAVVTGLSLAIFADDLKVNEKVLALKSYKIADSMLEARKAKEN